MIDTATDTVVATVFSNDVSVIETGTNTVIATVSVGTSPAGVAGTPTGTRAHVANSDSDNVSVINTATNTLIATIRVGMTPLALGLFIGPAGVAPPATNVDLNQHGLTGSWYEAATSGQGFEVEVFADPSSGTGSTFVSWFTYDTVPGGAEGQRW